MNARTVNPSDYLDTQGNKYIDTCHITSHCAQPLITTKRVNTDHQSNTHGHKVIDLCKTCNFGANSPPETPPPPSSETKHN